jgi:hypothetical protein
MISTRFGMLVVAGIALVLLGLLGYDDYAVTRVDAAELSTIQAGVCQTVGCFSAIRWVKEEDEVVVTQNWTNSQGKTCPRVTGDDAGTLVLVQTNGNKRRNLDTWGKQCATANKWTRSTVGNPTGDEVTEDLRGCGGTPDPCPDC